MMSDMLAHAFESSCMLELQALKPGNVHVFSDGHGMSVNDFVLSAKAVSNVISRPDLSLGKRVLLSVEATQAAVGCNTNLGIILLCAPIIQAKLDGRNENLQSRLHRILLETTIEDARDVFQAIRLANPGGLGQSQQYDVNQVTECSLLDAMYVASERDLIAAQYAKDFADIFENGLMTYLGAIQRYNRAWATTILHLSWMANYLDSHVLRKHGHQVATSLRVEAKMYLQKLLAMPNPKQYQKTLLLWDAELKGKRINPGTSADMTVASLFLADIV